MKLKDLYMKYPDIPEQLLYSIADNLAHDREVPQYDKMRMGEWLDKYPELWADFGEPWM